MRSLAALMILSLTACPSDDPEGGGDAVDSGVAPPAADSGTPADAGIGVEDGGVADAGRADIRRFGPPEIGPEPGLDGGPVDKGVSVDGGEENPPVDRIARCIDFCQNGFLGFDDQGNEVDCAEDRQRLMGVDDPNRCAEQFCNGSAEDYTADQWWLFEACVFERQCGDRADCDWNRLDAWTEEACTNICADQGDCDGDRFGANCAAGCSDHLQARGPRLGAGIAMCHQHAQDNQACFEEVGTPEELAACVCDVRDGCLDRTQEQVLLVTTLYCRLNEACTGEPNDEACRNGYWFDHMAATANLDVVASCLRQFDEAHGNCEGDAFQELDACIR